MNSPEQDHEIHRVLVSVRALLHTLDEKQRLRFFDAMESGFCVGCGLQTRNEIGSCDCLVDVDDED